MKPITSCSHCSSGLLSYFISHKGIDGVCDGRVKYNEISTLAILGCNECGETLQILQEHEIEALLNERFSC